VADRHGEATAVSAPPLALGVATGSAVWVVLAVVIVGWLIFTEVAARLGRPRVPVLVAATRWVVSSWSGRVLALAAWAAVGWHVFCQRP
jgi:hypothetical protein